MNVYTYFSIPGIGYSFFKLSNDGSLVEAEVPEKIKKLFITEGLRTILLRDETGNIGCIRKIDTEWVDENNRPCYINIAFQEEFEENNVPIILNAATACYEAFATQIRRVFEYFDQQYNASMEKYNEFLEFCRKCPLMNTLDKQKVSYFSVLNGFVPEKIITELNFSVSETKVMTIGNDRADDMEIFLYCNSPSFGYQLKKYAPDSKEPIGTSRQVIDSLGEELYSMLVISGMKSAFFRDENGRLCFLTKNLYSQDKKINASFILRCAESSDYEKMLYAVSAWSRLSPSTVAKELTECITLYFGERGSEFDVNRFMQTLEKYCAQNGDGWDAVSVEKYHSKISSKKYLYAIPEISLDDYNNSHKIKIRRDQIMIFPKKMTVPESNFHPSDTKTEIRSSNSSACRDRTQQVNHDDRIDLLQTKWFVPVAIATTAILIGSIVWLTVK